MKRSIFSDFLIKLSFAFAFAFLISLVFSYLYFKKSILLEHEQNLNNTGKILIKDALQSKAKEAAKAVVLYKSMSVKPDLSELKTVSNASFIVILNKDGFVEASDDLNINTLKDQPFLNTVLKSDSGTQIIHAVPKNILPPKFMLDNVQGKTLLVLSTFSPVNTARGKKILWLGYLMNQSFNLLFKDITFFNVDFGLVFDGANILTSQFKNENMSYILHNLKEISQLKDRTKTKMFIKIDNREYLAIKTPFYDYKENLVGYIVLARHYNNIKEFLNNYIIAVLLIFGFSSLVGTFFVTVYFRTVYMFFKGLIQAMERVKAKDFSQKLNEEYKIEEYKYITSEFNNMAEELKFYISKMQDVINTKVKEVLELNKAIRILDKQQNYEMLVQTSKNFLKNRLGFKVLDFEDCLKKIECSDCHLKSIAYNVEDQKVGLCVDLSPENGNFAKEFLDLFEEVFKINGERIQNVRRKEESYKESLLLSDILISLLKKRSVQEIFIYILEKARDFCNSDVSFIGLYDSKENKINLQFFHNINSEEFKKLSFPADLGLGGMVIREKRGIFVQNYFNDERIISPFSEVVRKEGLISNIAVPIFYNDEVFGILYVGYRSEKKLYNKEILFLEKLSHAASLSIEKEMLLLNTKQKEEELRAAYNEIITKRKELNDLLKSYKETNVELESINKELKEQYEVVLKSYEEINKLSKAKDVFLGILSHELKTPIAVLKGYLDTLLSGKFSIKDDVYNVLRACKKSLSLLNQIVEDTLDYARLEMGRVVIHKTPYPLSKMLTAIENELALFLKDRNITLEIDTEEGIFIECDAKWFKKVLFNVLINAIKFTPDNKKIRLLAKKVSKEEIEIPPHVTDHLVPVDSYWLIRVSDEGIGIPYSELNTIFDKFYELGDIKTHSSGTHKFQSKGFGLGLSFAKQIVKLHSGIIYAESPGYDLQTCPGSVFTIILPTSYEQVEKTKVPHDRKKILVMEGENEIVKFLELVLSKDYDVVVASDGGEGYLKTLDQKPDLILINVNLPKYDGYEVCSMIKEDKNIRKIPVILYATGRENLDESRAEGVKANMLFAPLFDIENLQKLTDYYLKKEEK